MYVGVIGNGFVGKATKIFGQCPTIKTLVYDVDPTKCEPQGITLDHMCLTCSIIFVCVPTPFNVTTNECDTSIVERVVASLGAILQTFSYCNPVIVVRSTVPPGTCERLRVCHMPEYLTEQNWHHDFITTPRWELGCPATFSPQQREHATATLKHVLTECKINGALASDELIVCDSCSTTEMAKYMRNVMLAVRISLCNELETYCRAKNINYNDVRALATADSRIGSSHTMVPGPDGLRGYGGTCLPKDLKALTAEMTKIGCTPHILQASSVRNDTVDRPEKDWMGDVGRAVSGCQ